MSGPGDVEGGYVDQALDALGGEGADFIVKGLDPHVRPAPYPVGLFCRTCKPGELTGIYSVGQIELWELVADARAHFEQAHAPAPVLGEAQPGGAK